MTLPSLQTSTDITAALAAAPRRRSLHAARRAGFSLMELLIVIVIVGIMAMTVAPSLSEVLSGNRHASAAMDLVRFARRTRSAAISSGAAQLMRFDQSGSGRLGLIERYAGMTSRCMQSRWDIAMGDPGHGALRALQFDMADYNPSGGAPDDDDSSLQVIKMTAQSMGGTATDRDEVWLCYQPDGQVYAQLGSTGSLAVQDVDVLFTLTRSIGGDKHGVPRRVLFPSGGNARLQ